MLFAGVKDLDYISHYEEKYNLPLFDRVVDFGLLYFITKPIFIVLHNIYNLVGNFGVAIILLTLLIKILLLPLSIKGFKSMNKLKDLSPKMMEIKDKFKDDNMRMQQEMMNLHMLYISMSFKQSEEMNFTTIFVNIKFFARFTMFPSISILINKV